MMAVVDVTNCYCTSIAVCLFCYCWHCRQNIL